MLSRHKSGSVVIDSPLQTITFVAGAMGYTLDVVFGKTDAPSTLGVSDEVRAKLADRQVTPADVAAAVEWVRVNVPSA